MSTAAAVTIGAVGAIATVLAWKSQVPLRSNVLLLVGLGYVSVLAVFFLLISSGGLTAGQAYDAVNGPLMALVGGSIALAKDLLRSDEGNGAE